MQQAPPSISPVDLYARLGTATAPTVVDVRRPADFAKSGELIVSAFHRDPDEVKEWEEDLPRGPRVAARKAGVSPARCLKASPSSAMPAVSCSCSLANSRCEAVVSRGSVNAIARSTPTMTAMPRRRASAQRSTQKAPQRLSTRTAWQSASNRLHRAASRSTARDLDRSSAFVRLKRR